MPFDPDCIEVAAKDLSGNVHEFPELNNLVIDGFDIKSVFDTSGWNPKSKIHQQRAQRIVDYYSQHGKMDDLYQFNVSINPFHSMLEKSTYLKKQGCVELSEKIYKAYIDRMANTLFTFAPLMTSEKFGIIARALSDDIPNMQGYNAKSLNCLIGEIYENFMQKCINDLFLNQIYVKNEDDLKNMLMLCKRKLKDCDIDTNIVPSKKIKEIILERNPDKNSGFFNDIFSEAKFIDEQYNELKLGKELDNENSIYRKLIDITGKVYLSDNQRIIPTDIQLNYINRNKVSDTFHTLDDSFVYKLHNSK